MKKLIAILLCAAFTFLPLVETKAESDQIPTLETLQQQYPDCDIVVEYTYDYSQIPTNDSVTVIYPQDKILGCLIIVVVVTVVIWGVTIYIVYRICKKKGPVVPTPPPAPITNFYPFYPA